MKKNPAAVALGRLGGLKGGKSKSERKAAAARKNGQKGGWPKGKARKGKPMNLEPMTVKTELRDSKGRKVKVVMMGTCPEHGAFTYAVPDFPEGMYRQTVSVKGTPRKRKKGKR